MSNENLSFNVGPQEIPDQAPLQPAGAPTSAASPEGLAAQNSTIAPSGVSQIETASEASVPMIPYPVLFQFFENTGAADSAEGAKTLSGADRWSLTESEIVLSMLNQWNDSIKEEAAEEKRRSSDPNEIRKREENRATANVLSAITDAAKSGETRGDIVPLVTVGLIFAGTGGVTDAMMIDTASTRMVGVNPTMNQAPDLAIYTSDLRAELGLLGAALLQGAAYTANAESVFKNGGTGAANEVTAKAYADQIMGLVSSGQLTLIVQKLVAQDAARTGKPVDPELAQKLESQLKVILLSTALVALYTSAKEGGTGWIKGSEFLGLLNGENKTFGTHKDLMNTIVQQIGTHLDKLPQGGKDIKETLANYFNENPSLQTLTNPSRVLAELMPYIRRHPEDNPA